ncbi:MAG: undecaprenyl-diphosphate phosphatase [Alphaproteobacteria bacterium]|nr:undecaprenyl-diphosphate phosphatase [Alphaproteobacteria bacterium]
MAFFPIAILALVQGITEFLPISSSGHLILTRLAMAEAGGLNSGFDMALTQNQALAFDVAVHLGTLIAVIVYFRRDVATVIAGCLDVAARRHSPAARLAINVAVASLPVGIVGLTAKDMIENLVRDPAVVLPVIAVATIGFAILLHFADRQGARRQARTGPGEIDLKGAVLIGLAQTLALIPGTSRAGVTMTAARALGCARVEAARFSMLLSIPAIVGAGLLLGRDVVRAGEFVFGMEAVAAMVLSFLAALFAVVALMRWLARAGFTPFVLYRIALGTALLIWVFVG